MNKINLLVGIICGVVLSGSVALAADDYKGTPSTTEMTASFMGGFGLVDTSGGFALTGALAKKILDRGFVSDLNDPIFIEVEFGPMFTSGITAWMYSAHLRWDFVKDPAWTFFAIGGMGANTISVNSNTRFALYPRFGVGAFYTLPVGLILRAEVSHEQVVAGVSVAF